MSSNIHVLAFVCCYEQTVPFRPVKLVIIMIIFRMSCVAFVYYATELHTAVKTPCLQVFMGGNTAFQELWRYVTWKCNSLQINTKFIFTFFSGTLDIVFGEVDR